MKKLILSVFMILISWVVVAQEETDDTEYFSGKHEVCFIVSTNSLMSNDLTYYWLYDAYDFESLYLLDMWQNKNTYGIGYKYQLGKGAVRVKTFGVFNTDHIDDDSNDNYSKSEIKYNYTKFNAKLGYQFNKNFKRTQLNYGIDLTFHIDQLEYKSEREYEQTIYPYYVTTYVSKTNEKVEKQSFGLSPFVGIRYFITPHISLFTETMLTFEYYEGTYKYKREVTSSPTSEDKSSTSGTNTDIGPVGQIGVGIHF